MRVRIGRPLRIGIVPVVAGGDLLGVAGGGVHHPEMAALVVVPAGVVELVRDVRVVAHVALAGGGRHVVAGPGAAHHYQPLSVGRPLKRARAVLEVSERQGFAAIHGKNADLRALRLACWGIGAGGVAAGDKRQALAVGTPTGRSRIESLCGEAARRGVAIDRDHPNGVVAPVAALVDGGENVGRLLAVGRDVRVRDGFEREVIFGSDSTLGRAGGQSGNRKHETKEGATHRQRVYRSGAVVGLADGGG